MHCDSLSTKTRFAKSINWTQDILIIQPCLSGNIDFEKLDSCDIQMNILAPTVAISALWGIAPIIQKYAMNTGMHGPTILALSGAGYYTCLFLYVTVFNFNVVLQDVSKSNASTIMLLLASGIIAGFFANVLFIHTLNNNNSYMVVALSSAAPLFAALFAYTRGQK